MIAKRQTLRCIDSVKRVVEEEIRTNGSRMIGRGLTNEASPAGTIAMVDVEVAAVHGTSARQRVPARGGGGKDNSMARKKGLNKDFKWPRAITLWGYASETSEAWRQAKADGYAFAMKWARQAVDLGWTEENLVGLIWSLQGRQVVAMTARRAVIMSTGGGVTFYRRMVP
jgi:hypothetical protein